MSANGAFREDELITKQVAGQVKVFPVVGARLRIFHENNDQLSIKTKIIKLEPDFVVIRAAAKTTKGRFNGTGTASTQRDARLADSLVELAETRAIARALRFSGVGCEYTSAEEVSHLANTEPEPEQTTGKESKPVFPEEKQSNKPEAKPVNDKSNGDGSKATQAQVRAIRNIAFNRNRMSEQDLVELITEYGVKDIPDLSRQAASDVIQSLQAQAA